MVYIAVLRLSELPAKEFRRMIASQDAGKMHALLSFLFTDEGSHAALEKAWCVEFEDGFVRDQLLGNIHPASDIHNPNSPTLWFDCTLPP